LITGHNISRLWTVAGLLTDDPLGPVANTPLPTIGQIGGAEAAFQQTAMVRPCSDLPR